MDDGRGLSLWKKPRVEALEEADIVRLGYGIMSRYDYFSLYNLLALTGQRVSEALALRGRDLKYDVTYDERIEKERPVILVNSITLKSRRKKARQIQVFDIVKYYKHEDQLVKTPMWDAWQLVKPRVERIQLEDPDLLLFDGLNRSAFGMYLQSHIAFDARAWVPKTGKFEIVQTAMHPHYLRHCKATWWGRIMRSPQELANQMGWTDLRPAMTYYNPPIQPF